MVSGIEDEDSSRSRPVDFLLYQNHPNPFNPSTAISFSLRTESHVTLDIYNVLGQKVRTLVDESKNAGNYEVNWDGKDVNGKNVTGGIYFYRIQAGEFVDSKKMVILK
jgi:flagellar hook assembly protein FlgD